LAGATRSISIGRTDDAVNLPAADTDVREHAVAQGVELCPLPLAQPPSSDTVEEVP
jgi:hypothetical protein